MDTDSIKKIIEEFLDKMGVHYEEIVVFPDPKLPRFLVKSQDSRILIGAKGEHLSAINYLIKRMIGKKVGSESVKVSVDVNNYLESLLREIRNKATILAERARSFKTSVEMEPMNPYERMIIHSFFEGSPDIVTESSGFGEMRRVVIKYKERMETEE